MRISVGDRVLHKNGVGTYEVLAIYAKSAWIKDETGLDFLTLLDRLSPLGEPDSPYESMVIDCDCNCRPMSHGMTDTRDCPQHLRTTVILNGVEYGVVHNGLDE
jgi:hypothetical protein